MMDGHASYTDWTTSSPLRKYFEQNLRIGTSRSRVQCHVLSDIYQPEDWKDEPTGPHRSSSEFLQVRHTILVFLPQTPGASSSPSKKKCNESVLVMGMTAWEYAYNNQPTVPSRAYIQHVDTTGLFRPRKLQGSLTRMVISAYFRYCRMVTKVGSVHLFSSSKPSLIFNDSEKLPKKRVIEGGRLVNWWLALIESAFADVVNAPSFVQQNHAPPRGFVYCAGEDFVPLFSQSLRNNINTLNRLPYVEWKYGVPFGDKENAAVIPLFDDDPKWRHYEASLERSEERPAKRQKQEQGQEQCSVNVLEFFQSMSFRTEFRQDPSAFITVTFPDNASGTPFLSNSSSKRSDAATFSCKLLQTLSFATETEALKSSMRMWAWLKLMGSKPIEVADEEGSTDHADKQFLDILNELQVRTDTFREEAPLMAVDVQTLIRRKIPRA
ncbi:hypothetical protein PSACC_03575 [Paramicrosporidium saccamoebae]|uniref:histone acetyltransferase n=1 Tax=Paramicrosporidium saccamoebae TaxID=1246581 RepID=A0A2H9TFL1_9FUNG|nr:hypothetical protein PSACC_03575 [Paramicrosporidium saccamoebae]